MAKEILKPNQVDAPSLFIGVGGTGCKIVKKVAEMCKPQEKENINFVCLDTNVNDLSGVTQSNANIYYVQTSSTQTVGDYLNYDKDALDNWFPKNAVIYDKTVTEGAGQVRAISRLALNAAIKTGKMNPLYDAIDDLFRKDGKDLKQAMRLVIATTASGGTGSGMALPLAMVVRDYVDTKYPNTSLIVRSLMLLPETLDSVISSNAEKESQRRNAYATIKEVNAFMMKGSGFFDVDSDLKRYEDLHVDVAIPGSEETRPLSLLPFDFCFLLDGQNAEDNTLVSIDQYINQAARALYEQNIGPMQGSSFSMEDNIIKEMSNPDNLGRNRFGGIGASTIRYPYDEIVKYIACDWAMDAIGGEGEAAKWTRYDREYETKRAEARKKGLSESECPKLPATYIMQIDAGDDNFSKDLRARYLNNAQGRVSFYFEELDRTVQEAVGRDVSIADTRNNVAFAAHKIDYANRPDARGKAEVHKEALREYESTVRARTAKVASAYAEGLFRNERKTILEKNSYALESLIKNALGEVAHPNAIRYMLYLVKNEMDRRINEYSSDLRDRLEPGLFKYSQNARDKSFNLEYTRKEDEENLDALCACENHSADDPSLLQKLGGYEAIYAKLNKCFQDYYRIINEYCNVTAQLETYKIGSEYIGELNKSLEYFFSTFPEKVTTLLRKQEELVDGLRFEKGDSVMNVCADAALLKELSRSTNQISQEGSMLDSELNGNVFDAIKKNVAFEREIRNADVVEDDRRIDIFDQILMGYFEDSVRRNCENIDQNIIEAIALENKLIHRVKARENMDGEEKIFDNVSIDDNVRHIKEVIRRGRRLAAPGIQRMSNQESREITLCAYNESLDKMRNYRMKNILDDNLNGEGVNTVSRYQMNFFNAIYNLIPNRLNKFAPPMDSETGDKEGGLYHNAYFSYAKNIGPDSTKGAIISTHIDKRWDSMAVMPEMDFKFQNAQIMKVHKALIYGLLYGAISLRNLSNIAGAKKVYKYENSDERFVELVVSNGTLCDEFYEILDALYISSAIVEDIEKISVNKSLRDTTRNANYEDTVFAGAVGEFCVAKSHEGDTSLFEIPLCYYNSLPNSLRYTSEISALTEAVIDVFRMEMQKHESENDVAVLLSQILYNQFMLLADNYAKYESLNMGIPANENVVLDIVFRKIRSAMEDARVYNSDALIRDMRARVR